MDYVVVVVFNKSRNFQLDDDGGDAWNTFMIIFRLLRYICVLFYMMCPTFSTREEREIFVILSDISFSNIALRGIENVISDGDPPILRRKHLRAISNHYCSYTILRNTSELTESLMSSERNTYALCLVLFPS